MIGLIGRAVAMVQTVGTSAAVVVDMMAVGIRQDLGEVEWPSPQGRTLLSNSSSPSSVLTLAFIYFFLSFFDARFAKNDKRSPPHLNLKGVVWKMDNN